MDHKKIILLLLVFIFKMNAFSKTYIFEDVEWVSIFTELYSFNDGIFRKQECDFNENWIETIGTYTIYEENSYTVAEVKFDKYVSKIFLFYADDKHLVMYDTYLNLQTTCTNSKYHTDEAYIWSIENCTASSYLTESLNGETISYKPENLANNDITKKWVEGVIGYGESEILRIKNDLTLPKRLYFLNGFFEPTKTYLYYENARIRNCLIRCYDDKYKLLEEYEHEFIDTGNFQVVDCNRKYNYFEIEIKSVYSGKKYKDTAISAIMVDGLSGL